MFQMVISLSSWTFPGWLTRSTAAKKRKLAPDEDDKMDVDNPTNETVEAVKKLKLNPPCKQCQAGLSGHRSHVIQKQN